MLGSPSNGIVRMACHLPLPAVCMAGSFIPRFASSEEAAEYPAMRQALAAILDLIPAAGDPDDRGRLAAVSTVIGEFVARFR